MNRLFLLIFFVFISNACLANTEIVVDKAQHTLYLYKNKNLIKTYDVITGKHGFTTPNLSTTFKTISINPTWHLTLKEIRQMRLHPELIKKYGVTGSISKPSPKNPLGLARLNLLYGPTPIRIHGTSEPELFQTDSRLYSSGCVRVLEIKDLVQNIIGGNIDWSKSYDINLPESVKVVIH